MRREHLSGTRRILLPPYALCACNGHPWRVQKVGEYIARYLPADPERRFDLERKTKRVFGRALPIDVAQEVARVRAVRRYGEDVKVR